MKIKQSWLAEAEKHIGVKEVAGIQHEPKVLAWWRSIKLGGITDDETPWCAAFVGAMLEASGILSTRSGWARSYLNWGKGIDKPIEGAIVVFSRAGGGGHVGFITGIDEQGRLLVLGGNQGNEVNIKPFDLTRVIGYRWPATVEVPLMALSVHTNAEASSLNEA